MKFQKKLEFQKYLEFQKNHIKFQKKVLLYFGIFFSLMDELLPLMQSATTDDSSPHTHTLRFAAADWLWLYPSLISSSKHICSLLALVLHAASLLAAAAAGWMCSFLHMHDADASITHCIIIRGVVDYSTRTTSISAVLLIQQLDYKLLQE